MSTFRLIVLSVLAVLMAAYGYYWMSAMRIAPVPLVPSAVEAVITDQGNVQIGGRVFADSASLKAKIAELRQLDPGMEIRIRVTKDMKFETMGRGIQLLQDAGVEKIGFVTEPRTAPDTKER